MSEFTIKYLGDDFGSAKDEQIHCCFSILTTALMGSSFAIGENWFSVYFPDVTCSVRFIMAIVVKFIKRPHPKKVMDWMKLNIIGFFQIAGVGGFARLYRRVYHNGRTS
ncbi:hypothetical protein IOC57_09580 [Bacillus sp. SD075]|uniref:hypothetical protein n=1 Tax=Bacillus sp. SD075 TaxID=2781732 RepID=UPI001A96034D|nr:hypothetical protein [Bacillus sp. SD075]MBO0997997.1 hypothetical protein [Bacillus sp. SD075]